jgi:transposase
VQQRPLTLKSILNGFDSALSNGSVEAINGLIQADEAIASPAT